VVGVIAVPEWLPIETAPKQGRQMILLLTPSGFPQVAYSNTWWTAGFSVECRPTHWMPLPPVPVVGSPSQAPCGDDQTRTYALQEREAERERLKTIAHNRAGYEAASAAHHAGKCQPAFEMHMTRNAAMCDLIDALFGPKGA
jgi:hypothetical protein